jgi:hypothetical protein
MNKQVRHNIYTERGSRKEGQLTRKHYSAYRKTSYNTRTYQVDIDISSLLDSK